MLHSLLSLEDDQIDTVLNTVSEWCKQRGVAIESEEGRQAISTAVNLICTRNINDFQALLQQNLNYSQHLSGTKKPAGVNSGLIAQFGETQ